MGISDFSANSSIRQYIAELERRACSSAEAASCAALASQSGIGSLPEERREALYSYCLLQAANRVCALTRGTEVRAGMEPCDWVNEFSLTLEQTLRGYEPERSMLSTYISAAVDNFIRNYIADHDLRGRHYVSSVNQLKRKRTELTARAGCEPSDELLMRELGWGERRLHNVRNAERCGTVIRLNEPVGDDGELTIGDIVPSDEPGVEETAEKRIMLGRMRECLDSLPDDRSKRAMIRCIIHGESYGKVGEDIGASKEGVRKMVNRELERLRNLMCA